MSIYYPENQRQRRITTIPEPVVEVWEPGYSYYDDEPFYTDETAFYMPSGAATAVAPFNGLAIVGLALVVIVALSILNEMRPQVKTATLETANAPIMSQHGGQPTAVPPANPAPLAVKTNPIYPYDEYTITQGVHGYSYGHMAIDIAAGDGATIMSPIDGEITQLYTDEWGNPTLVIENDFYQITFLHGKYSVALGDKVRQGQPIGTESNLGYTMDMQGNLCYGRNCGYHTHLNIFDKEIGANINPLDVLR